MAIQIFCPICKKSYGLETTECSKCKTPFGKNKQYRVFISVKGDKRRTKVLPNLARAREWETITKNDLLKGEMGIRKPKKYPTLQEVWGKYYLPFAQQNKKSWADDKWYYHKHLESRFGNKPLNSIFPIDIERMKEELKEAGYAPATIKHQLAILRRLYNLAIKKWNLFDGKNPVDSVDMPKLDNQVTEYLNGEELAKLHRTLDAWPCKESAAFVRFALYTGFRKGELLRLQWQDVDFEKSMITLKEPKGGKTQILPISNQALEVIQDLEKTSPYIFPEHGGKQKMSFRRPWQKIKKVAGLPNNFRFHGLRHNFASHMVAEFGLEVVGKLLGHKDHKTTQRYSHLAPGVIKLAAQRSGELLSQRSKLPIVKIKPDNK